MTDGFLENAYHQQDARQLYDDWASSYEVELGKNGYATPGRCAAALKAHMPGPSLPVLDFGCGTGLSGLALQLAGFSSVDGIDLSADMLKQAADKTLYRILTQVEFGESLHHQPGDYAAIAAIGVIGAGAAPISVFDTLMHGLAASGLLVLSLNDHALQDPKNEAKLQSWIDTGQARLMFKEYGPHIPGIDLKSNIYIIEKT